MDKKKYLLIGLTIFMMVLVFAGIFGETSTLQYLVGNLVWSG